MKRVRMPPITAILHTCNDAEGLGRALESLRPCDELLVVDHGSTDATLRVAREYGARIHHAEPSLSADSYLASALHDWVLYVMPSESLTEGLEASLYEWKLYEPGDVASIPACSAFVREETREGWTEGRPSTRLIPKGWNLWDGNLPRQTSQSMMLQGDLLRFRLP